MKIIRYLFLLLLIAFMAYLVSENQDFFMAKTSLTMNLKWKELVIPEIQILAYFGMVLFLGLFIVGTSSFMTRCRLKKQIRQKDAEIDSLNKSMQKLENELNFFIKDPYIKVGLENLEKNNTDTSNSEIEETKSAEAIDSESENDNTQEIKIQAENVQNTSEEAPREL